MDAEMTLSLEGVARGTLTVTGKGPNPSVVERVTKGAADLLVSWVVPLS